MNPEEISAEKYLRANNCGALIYEPEGYKKFPDFSLESTIGIEVRRLNENYFESDNATGLEDFSISIHKILKKVLLTFDDKYDGSSYYVAIDFKRPFRGKSKSIARDMTITLDRFLNGPRRTPDVLEVNDNIQLEVHPSPNVSGRVFRHAISLDEDSGGPVIEVYINNIMQAIKKKSDKITQNNNFYTTWWLILVDNIMAWDLEQDEIEEIKSGITSLGGYDQIIIIDLAGEKCLLQFNA